MSVLELCCVLSGRNSNDNAWTQGITFIFPQASRNGLLQRMQNGSTCYSANYKKCTNRGIPKPNML
eukprot:6978667-Ditylum_brightwellii.AAC.1